jgi:hypothetical protein
MAAKDNLIDKLKKVWILRTKTGTFGSTTLSSAAAATDTTIDVTADTNFTAGDPIRIGTGETLEFNWVDSVASDVITLARPLSMAHDSGAAVVEYVAWDMGPPLADGVNWSFAGQSVDINVGTQRAVFATLAGFISRTLGWTLPSFTPRLFAFATGMGLSRVGGSGTSAAPTYVRTDGSEFGEEADQTYIAQAETVSGDDIGVEFWGASTRVDNLSVALSRGQATPVPMSASAANSMFTHDVYDFTTDATGAAAAGTVWDSLQSVGLFVDTGTTTTLNGALSADATALVMTSGASFANGDWIKISGANGVEYTQLKDKSTNNFNLTIPVYRAIGNGVTITLVTETPFAAVAPAGVTLGVAVASQDINSAIAASPIHTRLGAATITIACGITDVTLANLAYALGVPQSDIVSATRFLASATNLGTENIDGVYLTGITKNGAVTRVIGAGTQVDIANVASTWTNQGEAAAIPFTVKPTSYLALTQYSS